MFQNMEQAKSSIFWNIPYDIGKMLRERGGFRPLPGSSLQLVQLAFDAQRRVDPGGVQLPLPSLVAGCPFESVTLQDLPDLLFGFAVKDDLDAVFLRVLDDLEAVTLDRFGKGVSRGRLQ